MKLFCLILPLNPPPKGELKKNPIKNELETRLILLGDKKPFSEMGSKSPPLEGD